MQPARGGVAQCAHRVGVGRDLAGPGGHDQRDWERPDSVAQIGEEPHRGAVGALDVIDEQNERPGSGVGHGGSSQIPCQAKESVDDGEDVCECAGLRRSGALTGQRLRRAGGAAKHVILLVGVRCEPPLLEQLQDQAKVEQPLSVPSTPAHDLRSVSAATAAAAESRRDRPVPALDSMTVTVPSLCGVGQDVSNPCKFALALDHDAAACGSAGHIRFIVPGATPRRSALTTAALPHRQIRPRALALCEY